MGSDTTGGTVVTRRANGLVTTGCLTALVVLIILFGTVASWLWYRSWHDGNVNSERRDKAFASILEEARDTADDTARALDTTGTTDADALMGVIWQRSEAPVISYDGARREFTATAAKYAQYDAKGILPGVGPVRVTRCFVFTYTHRPGQAWTSKVSERGNGVCRPGTQIGSRVRLALTRISNMYAEDLTRAGIQDVLDPTGRRSFDVRSATREGDTVTVSVLVTDLSAKASQCYRFTRTVHDVSGTNSATAAPAISCE
ncbi:hypothetical protein [Streptomyces sp. NPDC005009]